MDDLEEIGKLHARANAYADAAVGDLWAASGGIGVDAYPAYVISESRTALSRAFVVGYCAALEAAAGPVAGRPSVIRRRRRAR